MFHETAQSDNEVVIGMGVHPPHVRFQLKKEKGFEGNLIKRSSCVVSLHMLEPQRPRFMR